MTKPRKIRYDVANDLYKLLGVPPTATPDEIQHAFRQLAKEVHPDRNPERVEWANQQFRKINDAYDILSDEVLRIEYDRSRLKFASRQEVWASASGGRRSSTGARYAAGNSDDWWNRPHARTRPPIRFTPRWRSQIRNYYAAVIEGLVKGPYRYVLAIIVLVFAANILIIYTTQGHTRAEITEGQLRQTIGASTLRAASVFVVGTLPPPFAVPTVQPSCANPNVNITEPIANAELNFESFNISGSATDQRFWSYMIMIESLDDKLRGVPQPASWVLQVPIRQSVRDGYLVKGVSIKNVREGRYLLRLVVRLTDNSILPPCEIEIRRKR